MLRKGFSEFEMTFCENISLPGSNLEVQGGRVEVFPVSGRVEMEERFIMRSQLWMKEECELESDLPRHDLHE